MAAVVQQAARRIAAARKSAIGWPGSRARQRSQRRRPGGPRCSPLTARLMDAAAPGPHRRAADTNPRTEPMAGLQPKIEHTKKQEADNGEQPTKGIAPVLRQRG